MKAKTLVTVLAATLVAGGASIACAQPAESTFQLVTELHIVPGQEVEFETINKARNTRLAEGNVTFRLFRHSGGNEPWPHRGTGQGRRGGSKWPGGTAHDSESQRPVS